MQFFTKTNGKKAGALLLLLAWLPIRSLLALAEGAGAGGAEAAKSAPTSQCSYYTSTLFSPGYGGILLDTTVRIPAASTNCKMPSGGWPMILSVHSYGTDKNALTNWAVANAQNGYMAATFSWRGHGNSTGTFRLLHSDEWQDLASLTNFLVHVYPSTALLVNPARVGIEGDSMGAVAAWVGATQNMGFRDALSENGSPFIEKAYVPNGCVDNSLALFWYPTGAVVNWDQATKDRLWSDYANMDSVSSLLDFFLAPDHNFSQAITKTSAYMFNQISFTDQFQFASPALSGYGQDPLAPKRLYLASNGHEEFLKFDDAASLEETNRINWHARWLQDKLNGADTAGPLSYLSYLAGDPILAGNHISATDTATWPPPGVLSTTLFLRAGGGLTLGGPSGNEGGDTITNTLLDPTFTITEAVMNELPAFAAAPSKIPTSIVVFNSPVLMQAVWWLGAPRVSFYTAADGPNYNLVALFYDVQVDSNGQDVTSYLMSRAQSCWHAGDAANRTMGGVDIARRVEAGHVIRVVFQNTDPETSLPSHTTLRTRPYFGNYTVSLFHNGDQPSNVLLPLKPDNPALPIFASPNPTRTPTPTAGATATPMAGPSSTVPPSTAAARGSIYNSVVLFGNAP